MATGAPRSAIVSGGAGGIGRVVSQRLADAGYRVVIADAAADNAAEVVSTLAAHSGPHRAVTGDLTQVETNRAAVAAATELGALSAVVNAVGISPKQDGGKLAFWEVEPELWDLVMAVNLKAPYLLTREAFRHMPADGTAAIVNVLSIVSRLGAGGLPTDLFPPFLPTSAVYAASKGALHNLTASLSRELSSFKIRVNGVAPGFVSTPMTSVIPPADAAQMTTQIPLGRYADPSEIVDAIEFLLSEKASYITGASLDVNGGALAC